MNIFRDLIFPVAGFLCVVAGVAMISKPSAMIVAGVLFIGLSLVPRK